MKIITAQEMKWMDRCATRDYGIPSLVLMENAGRALADFIGDSLRPPKDKPIFIVCGKGNNAGDGLVAARLLQERAYTPCVYLLHPESDYTGDAKLNLTRYAGPVKPLSHPRELRLLAEEARGGALIVDALFGTGLDRPVSGFAARVIDTLNRLKKPIVAADIPSGLDADSGEKRGIAIQASYTLCFHLPKQGLVLGPDTGCVGELRVVPIGIPKSLESKIRRRLYLNSPEDFARFLRPREKDTHKYKHGHVLSVAGSRKKIGAALLCARAALRAGAGLSTLALPESAYRKIQAKYAEIMFEPLPSEGDGFSIKAWVPLVELSKRKKVLACGPGMGTSAALEALVRRLVTEIPLPLVLDADGLNNLAPQKGILKKRRAPIVLTPHPGEMQRLANLGKNESAEGKINILRKFSQAYGAHVVLKGFRSLIAAPSGDVFVNPTGNPGMATAGTGDVLTGAIAGLIAQGLPFQEAVLAGVWLHGRAGDLAARAKGEVGLLAWDIAEKLPEARREAQDAN